jgi:hypothetical protein
MVTPKGSMSTEGETLQISVLPYRCSIAPFCCLSVCLRCCAAEVGSSGGTYKLSYIYIYIYIYSAFIAQQYTHKYTYVRICTCTGSCCNHCVHGPDTGLLVPNKECMQTFVFFTYLWFLLPDFLEAWQHGIKCRLGE